MAVAFEGKGVSVRSYLKLSASVCISLWLIMANPRLTLGQTDGDKTQSELFLGIGGDYTKIKDSASSQLSLFLGRYFASSSKLKLGVQTDLSWFNQQDLYHLGAEVGLLLEWRFSQQSARPFVLLGGGINAESIGAFNISRYPFGLGSGFRFPMTSKGFFQLDYKYRYIFNDPVEEFSIHQLSVGVAIYLN